MSENKEHKKLGNEIFKAFGDVVRENYISPEAEAAALEENADSFVDELETLARRLGACPAVRWEEVGKRQAFPAHFAPLYVFLVSGVYLLQDEYAGEIPADMSTQELEDLRVIRLMQLLNAGLQTESERLAKLKAADVEKYQAGQPDPEQVLKNFNNLSLEGVSSANYRQYREILKPLYALLEQAESQDGKKS